MSDPNQPTPAPATPVATPSQPPARRLRRLTVAGVLLVAALFVTAAALVITAPSAKSGRPANDPKDQRLAEPNFMNNSPRRPPADDEPRIPGRDPRIDELLRASRDPKGMGPRALTGPPPPAADGGPNPAGGLAAGSLPEDPPPPGAYRPYYARPAQLQRTARPSWELAFASSLSPASSAPSPNPTTAPPPTFQMPPLPSSGEEAPLESGKSSLPGQPTPTNPGRQTSGSSLREPEHEADRGAKPFTATATINRRRTLKAGTVLNAILLTAVSTQMEGETVALLTNDVYGSDGDLLLPRGARLVGAYKNRVALGDKRLAIAWDRILLGNRTVQIPGLPSTSADAAAGAPGSVNNHTALVFGRAAALSLIGAAGQLGQPRQSRLGATLSTGEVLSGSVSQQLSQAANEYLNSAVQVTPTIFIPAGSRVTVLLPIDLELP